MAKRATSKKSAKKAAPAKKTPAKKAAAPKAKKAAPAKKAAAKKATAKKAAPAKKAAAKKLKVATPVKKASPPPKKAKPLAPVPKPRKKSPARRAAAAVKSVAKTAASVVMAPVKAVAAVVAGPVVENPPESGERREEEDHEGSSNGVDAHADDEEEAHGEGGSDPEALIERLESAYKVTLPDRYRRFLREGEYRRYPRIELAGYIRGPYDLDFVDDLLPDVAELGQNAGIYDMDDVPWGDDYQGFVPLASLSHPEVDEPKVFLVQQVGGENHRVLLFDYEGWKLYPLADSFESFLSNLPQATNDISTSFRPGEVPG